MVDWLNSQDIVNEMFEDITTFLEKWLPQVAASNRSYVTVAIGCTGGCHRSVYMAERLSKHFSASWPQVLTRHAEI